jgi:hypothetical protein
MKREKNKLTATKIRALNDPGFYNDGFGLNLQVRRFWSVRYTDDEGKHAVGPSGRKTSRSPIGANCAPRRWSSRMRPNHGFSDT